jgi:hypothetical protein
LCCGNRGRNRSNRTEQDERIVLGRNEATPLPEGSGFVVNRVDHQCATANEPGLSYAALKSVFDQTCSNPTAYQPMSVASCPSSRHGTESGG